MQFVCFARCARFILSSFLFVPLLAMAINHDAEITAYVKAAMAKNELTQGQLISVETHKGVVVLKGKADSVTEATKAIEIAAATKNVSSVDSTQLFVLNSSQPLSDTYITAKIKGVFLKNNLTAGTQKVPLSRVSVETQNGVVYLKGTDVSAAQRAKLIELAKSVQGVTHVKSSLEINKAGGK